MALSVPRTKTFSVLLMYAAVGMVAAYAIPPSDTQAFVLRFHHTALSDPITNLSVVAPLVTTAISDIVVTVFAGGGGDGPIPFGGYVFCRFATIVSNPSAEFSALLEFSPPQTSKSVTLWPSAISDAMID